MPHTADFAGHIPDWASDGAHCQVWWRALPLHGEEHHLPAAVDQGRKALQLQSESLASCQIPLGAVRNCILWGARPSWHGTWRGLLSPERNCSHLSPALSQAAAAIYGRFEAACNGAQGGGRGVTPEAVLDLSFDDMRGAGLSSKKASPVLPPPGLPLAHSQDFCGRFHVAGFVLLLLACGGVSVCFPVDKRNPFGSQDERAKPSDLPPVAMLVWNIERQSDNSGLCSPLSGRVCHTAGQGVCMRQALRREVPHLERRRGPGSAPRLQGEEPFRRPPPLPIFHLGKHWLFHSAVCSCRLHQTHSTRHLRHCLPHRRRAVPKSSPEFAPWPSRLTSPVHDL